VSTAFVRNLEEARLQLSEALLILWDHAELIDRLLKDGKPAKTAEDLMAMIQRTIKQLRQQIELLTESPGSEE
jgi:Mg2+ and Co2+ transporter CorA